MRRSEWAVSAALVVLICLIQVLCGRSLQSTAEQHLCPCAEVGGLTDSDVSTAIATTAAASATATTATRSVRTERLCVDMSLVHDAKLLATLDKVLRQDASVTPLRPDDPLVIRKVTGRRVNISSCDVLLVLYERHNMLTPLQQRWVCPGQCHDMPSRLVSVHHMLGHHAKTAAAADAPVLCSLSVSMLHDIIESRQPVLVDKRARALRRFRIVYWRVLMECLEARHWQQRFLADSEAHHFLSDQLSGKQQTQHVADLIPRRPVESVVLWIGTLASFSLIQEQSFTISNQPWEGSHAVIGWAATDVTFNCSMTGSVCQRHDKARTGRYLPRSSVNQNSFGWKCAQRRPLRALALVLRLMDPRFLILGDDDTFVNYPLLRQRFGPLLTGSMLSRPAIIGELTGVEGDRGHVTKKGVYGGGAGYILGQELLRALVRSEVKFWAVADLPKAAAAAAAATVIEADRYRSVEQIMHLSLVAEGLSKAAAYCDIQGDACIQMPPRSRASTSDQVVSLGASTRLVDFCVNLMANENTCLHSDHSVSRCLVYGAFADALGSTCHSTVPITDAEAQARDLWLGMCFMTPFCNVSEHVTCHRYKPSITSFEGQPLSFNTVPILSKRGYYRLHSSMFDGNRSDTYMR